MPFTTEELQTAGKAALDFYMKNNPIDQVATERPLLKYLMGSKKSFPGAKQYLVEQLRKSYDSNFQWYRGDSQVSYNKRKTIEQAQYPWSSCHDGFSLNEDELFQNGITITEGKAGNNTGAERLQLTNLLQENTEVLRLGFEEKFDYELHLDGTQNAESLAGLDYLLPTDGTTGTVGGIDRAANAWWQSNAATAIAKADLIETMEQQWRNCSRNGGKPTFILAGETFIDELRGAASGNITRYLQVAEKGGIGMDPSIPDLYFHGVPVYWDPVFADLDDALAPAVPWQNRCYFLNTKHIRLRPAAGHDMVTRKPPRVYDRYTYYWGLTWKGALTMNRSNAHAVLAVSGA